MHWHITRNGTVPSWAWTADTKRQAQNLARAYRGSADLNGRRDDYGVIRCPETLCPDFQEFVASGARDRVEAAS